MDDWLERSMQCVRNFQKKADPNNPVEYFWHHQLFDQMILENQTMHTTWNNLDAGIGKNVHAFTIGGNYSKKEIHSMLAEPTPLFKLSYRLYDAFKESRLRDLATGRTMVGPHKTDVCGVYAAKGIPASQCSTGEQKALLISIILANARALALNHGKAPLLLLDEISAHLDKDRRAALYEEICALELQAWMTGTERDLFEAFGNRAQYIQVALMDNISKSSFTG